MARTTIPAASIITPLGPYPSLPVAALSLDLAFQASDATNGNQFALGAGKYLLLARNTAGGAGTITLTSAPDTFKRTGDITTYSIAAGKQIAFALDQQAGWIQSDGNFYMTGSATTIEWCILRLV
jgi:hypothetical protein